MSVYSNAIGYFDATDSVLIDILTARTFEQRALISSIYSQKAGGERVSRFQSLCTLARIWGLGYGTFQIVFRGCTLQFLRFYHRGLIFVLHSLLFDLSQQVYGW